MDCAYKLAKENSCRLVSHFDSAASWTAFLLPDETLEKQKRNWPGDWENRHIRLPAPPKLKLKTQLRHLFCVRNFFC
jgi:hypothetical protein